MYANSSSVTALGLIATILAVTMLFALVSMVFLCNCFSRRRRRRSTSPKTKVEHEKSKIVDQVKGFLVKDGMFKFVKELKNLGSRLHKYWIEVEKEGTHYILTAAPLSKNCSSDFKGSAGVVKLNSLFQELNKHPFIHKIEKVDYFGEGFVSIIQELIPRGSLRDKIYGHINSSTGYDVSWSEKINEVGLGLPTEEIIHFGTQILDAMIFLKGVDFPHFGHIHSGNIFIVGGVCRVGGLDNTVLGYRTSLFSDIVESNLAGCIDTIMFGRMIYEMHAGRESSELIPTKKSINDCDDVIKKFLKDLFETKFFNSSKLKHRNLKEIYENSFFTPDHSKFKKSPKRKVVEVDIAEEMRDMLKNIKP